MAETEIRDLLVAFTWQELEVVAGSDVAFGFGIITCAPAGQPAFPVRLTIGLRRESTGWEIVNEHHSVPST
jgi:ketosteroid isomerase-like protein